MSIKKYEHKWWLRRKLHKEHKSPEQIAKECNVNHMTIRRWIDKHGL